MPGGDSVWRLARRLHASMTGRVITRSDLRVPRFATADLGGKSVVETVSRGKHLLTRFDGGLTLHTPLANGRLMERGGEQVSSSHGGSTQERGPRCARRARPRMHWTCRGSSCCPRSAARSAQPRRAGNLWVNELCFVRGHSPRTAVGEVAMEPLLALAHRLLKFSVSMAALEGPVFYRALIRRESLTPGPLAVPVDIPPTAGRWR